MIVTLARFGLALIFVVLGVNGFFHFIPTPPMSGFAATFFNTMLASHYSVMVFGVQVIAGVLLLIDQFVPLAMVVLAAVLANVLDYHITMLPSGLPLPLFTTLLWFIVAWPLRSHFGLLFARKPHVS